MSSIQAIENLINGYATSEDSSFLIPNATRSTVLVFVEDPVRYKIELIERDL